MRWFQANKAIRRSLLPVGPLVLLLPIVIAVGQPLDLIDTHTPSQAVYPPHGYPMRVAHALHAGLMPCAQCHGEVAASTLSAESHLPTMEQCGACHAEADDTTDPDACRFCHQGYWPVWPHGGGLLSVRDPRFPAVPPQPVRRFRPNLIFSHAQHVEVACAACHGEATAAVPTLPDMDSCVSCHQERGATVECAACHPTSGDGRLTTWFPGDDLTPAQTLRPRDHDLGWDVGHAAAAGLDAGECFACHTERACLSCHEGALGVDSPHPPGFRTHHDREARAGATDCASCHTVSGFCVDCHIDSGVSDDLPQGSLLGTRFHQLGWVDSGGGEHGRAAQRNLLECASCHQESTCAQCHVDVNPHASSFFARCETMLSASPSVCWRCHAEDERMRLQALCR